MVAGMVEVEERRPGAAPEMSVIENLVSGARYIIYQDLGTGSQSCSLDSTGLSASAGELEAALSERCALVIISKYGKEEAAGRGFCSAFRKAILLDLPVLTSVNPIFEADWQDFSGGLGTRLAPCESALQQWWAETAAAHRSPAAIE